MSSPVSGEVAAQPDAQADGRAPARGWRWRILGNEVAKELRIVWARRAMLPATVATTLVTYLAIQYFLGGGQVLDRLVAITAPGLFAYIVAFVASLRVVAGLLEERNTGTLEQTHLGPVPGSHLVGPRVLAAMVEATLVGAVLVVGVVVVRGVAYAGGWAVLLPLALVLVDIAAFALLLGAASFTFPGIGSVVHVLQMMVMALNGTIVPPELFPRWLELVADLAPTTLAVTTTRTVLVEGRTLGHAWDTGALGWAALHAAAFLAAGWVAYRIQVRRARDDGGLGPT